jgi:nucleoside-diphosphate-sugar epimerase
MATYLVTGAAGFIASRTCSLLLDAGHKVVGIDNLNDYYDPRLKSLRLHALQSHPRFEFHQMDIENLPELQNLFAKNTFAGILNLAARAGVRYSLVNPHVYFSTNSTGTLNLLECARSFNVKQFVLASTSSLYAGQPMPFIETLPVNTPISPYAASKKAAEVTAYTYHSLFDIDVAVVRYFTVYGPAGRPDMSIFRFIRWIDCEQPIQMNGNGNQSRDFTFVDDIARGTVAALGVKGYEIINLGGGNNPISMNTVISMLENLLGKKASLHNHPFHKADMESTYADIDKAARLLHWKPTVSLEEGLKKSVEWYQENKELACSVSVSD